MIVTGFAQSEATKAPALGGQSENRRFADCAEAGSSDFETDLGVFGP